MILQWNQQVTLNVVMASHFIFMTQDIVLIEQHLHIQREYTHISHMILGKSFSQPTPLSKNSLQDMRHFYYFVSPVSQQFPPK
jgi:vancomycin permeability regulator SanA